MVNIIVRFADGVKKRTMTDQQMMIFLMNLSGYLVQLHERSRDKTAPAAEPAAYDHNTINWEHEGFSRWMGWRGEEDQEREVREMRNEKGI